MTFDAREALKQAEIKHPPFEFIGMDGETYELPNPYLLRPAELRRQLGLEPDDDMVTVGPDEFLEKCVPEQWAAIQEMPLVVQNDIIDAWKKSIEFEDDDAGKESSPSSPRNRAERRSKPTSRSAASTSGPKSSGKRKAASAPS